MIRMTWRFWVPVIINGVAALAVLFFTLIPFNRRARDASARVARLEAELQARLAVLAALPDKRGELNRLADQLSEFRSALHHTDEIHMAMSVMQDRAGAAGVSLWTLDPSLPTLLTLEQAKDSVAALHLALLPVTFECHGPFTDIGRFLELEERRPEFCQWSRLTVSSDNQKRGVRVNAEILLFLLPAADFAEGAS